MTASAPWPTSRTAGRLLSRNGNTFKSFPELTAAIGTALGVTDAVLDGEIVHLGCDGKEFHSLMRRLLDRRRQPFQGCLPIAEVVSIQRKLLIKRT